MSVDVAAIKARLEAVQPGPWQAVESAGDEGVWWVERRNVSTVATDLMGADAKFIAHAPADIAALLAEVEQAERARARAVVQLGEAVTRAESAEAERDAALERLAQVWELADEIARPFADGVPDREGEALAAAIRTALGGEAPDA